jgi:hypothetical protein
MTILTHNIYRLFASFPDRSNERIYEILIVNNGNINIHGNEIAVDLKKKRDLPLIPEMTRKFNRQTYLRMGNKSIRFVPVSTLIKIKGGYFT